MSYFRSFTSLFALFISSLSTHILAETVDVELGSPIKIKAYGCPQGQKSVIVFKRPGQIIKFKNEDSKNPYKGKMAGTQILGPEYEVSVECRRVYCVLVKKPFSFTKYSIALEPDNKSANAQTITNKYRTKKEAKIEINKLIGHKLCSHERNHRTGKGWVESFTPYNSNFPYNID